MDKEIIATTEKVIGDTVYIIEYAVSDSAKETAYDKVKKLILSETGSLEYRMAS